MASLYDKADIYDLIESESRWNLFKIHWENILRGRDIETLLDVSIGSGSATLQLAELWVRLSGSDLSGDMLEKCGGKAAARGLSVDLKRCDFRTVGEHFSGPFDCVASTGNSLPYVSNDDVLKTLEQMDSLVKPSGYLYFEIRNWDKILREKQRFYLYSPFFDRDTRINLVQVWDYHQDGSMTFNLLYTFEKDNRIFQKEVFEEHYQPIGRAVMLDKLKAMRYGDIQILNYPSQFQKIPPEDADWYCVIGRKNQGGRDESRR